MEFLKLGIDDDGRKYELQAGEVIVEGGTEILMGSLR